MDRELEEFFAQARAISLPREQILAMHATLKAHMGDFPVRKAVLAGLADDMDEKRFAQSVQQLSLPEDRVAHVHANLLQFMAHHPVGSYERSGFFGRLLGFKPLAASLVVALMACGGTAYAAESSLPGDVLYPVKIAGEQVRSRLYVSAQSKVHFELQRAERRLNEIERMAEKGRIDPQTYARVAAAFEAHVKQVEAMSDTMEDREAASDLESALAAHESVVEQIKERRIETKDMLQPIILSIRAKRSEMKTRAEVRDEKADTPLENREKKLDAVRLLLEKNKDALPDDAKATIELKLKSAQTAIDEARLKLQDEHGLRELDSAKHVRENLQDVKALIRENTLRKELKLNIKGRLQPSSASSISSSTNNVNEVKIEVETEEDAVVNTQTETVTSASNSVSADDSTTIDVQQDTKVQSVTDINIDSSNTVNIQQE